MGKSGGGGNTTTVQKSDPWSGVQPYLLGGTIGGSSPQQSQQMISGPLGPGQISTTKGVINIGGQPGAVGQAQTGGQQAMGIPGLFPEAARLYGGSGWTPEMQHITNQHITRQGDLVGGLAGAAWDTGANFRAGAFDPNISPVGGVQAPAIMGGIAGAQPISTSNINIGSVLRGMGDVSPTQAIQQLLSGQANLDTLNPVVDNALLRMSQSFNEQFMPQLRSGGLSAGQYGGSRQGIAEGLAGDRLAQAMGETSAGMHNQAYNLAQQLMGQTAGHMSSLGVQSAQQDAARRLQADQANAANQLQQQMFNTGIGERAIDRNLAAQQFNTGVGLQNNQQAMQQAQMRVANQLQGLGIQAMTPEMLSQLYQSQLAGLNAGNMHDWNNLMRYGSIIQPGAGIGGQSSTTTPDNRNIGAGLIGGGLAGAQLAGLMGAGAGMTGLGAGAGALLGLLSDRRFKTDITPVGQLTNGLTVYKYRYITGGPMCIGVMADEVKKVVPEAVVTRDGVDYVDYGRL